MTEINRLFPIRVVIASINPVKIAATRDGFARAFPNHAIETLGISVESGVSDQPMGEAETLQGAYNRAAAARAVHTEGDYWVGIEGGCGDDDHGMQTFAWIVVLNGASYPVGRARTGAFYLPEEVASLVRTGMELGDADDIVFARSNSKQQNGSVGLLTNGALDRTMYYTQAVVMALIPFLNPEFTFS